MNYKSLLAAYYRCLAGKRLEIRNLNVLIGPNGSGKTAFLDVFNLLACGARQQLSKAISDRGGIKDIITYGADLFQLDLETEIEGDEHPLTYSLVIRSKGIGYEIAHEVLSPFRGPGYDEPFKWIANTPGHTRYYDREKRQLVEPTWAYDSNELALAQVPKLYEKAEQFRSRIAASRFFSFLDVGDNSPVRNPQNLEPGQLLPGPNGENLVSALYNMRSTHAPTFDRVLEAVRAAYPDFKSLEFPLVASGKATMIWTSEKFNKGFYPHQMSEGMLRFIWLSALLLSPDLPPVIAIDEPEVSLHPELLKILAGMLQEASQRTQIFVATHSDRLIRWLNPGDIVILDSEDGLTTFKRADDPVLNIDQWLSEYSLDEIWLMGELGGRP